MSPSLPHLGRLCFRNFLIRTQIFILVVSLQSFLVAQSDPSLSYSTFLPKLNFNSQAFPQGGFSVNSKGQACITDGIALYGYDSSGNVTFAVPDLVSAAPKMKALTVFRDEQANCFVAGNGSVITSQGQFPLAVAKFSSTGSLIYANYFGGNSPGVLFASASRVVADASGNAYVVGSTTFPDFPLKNPVQNLLQGQNDAFILKLDPSGKNLIYSTYFGADDQGLGIAIDASGNAYITGTTIGSADSAIPVTQGAFQTSLKSPVDAFVAKVDPTGHEVYGTYLGGSAEDAGFGIAVDASGNAYVAGATCSTDFPTSNAFQSSLAADCSGGGSLELSGFVSKLSPDGSTLIYSTFLGGLSGAAAQAIALDDSGAAYVAGVSYGVHFPLLNPIQSDFIDSTSPSPAFPESQAFVSVFTGAGSALQYSTFLGGFDPDVPNGIGVDATQNVYIGGGIYGSQSFPLVSASNGVSQPFVLLCRMEACDGFKVFIAKISPTGGTVLASPSTVDFGTIKKGTSSSSAALLIADMGPSNLQINSTTITGDYSIANNTCSGPLPSATHCEVDVVFSPTAGGTRPGTLTLSSSAPDSPRNIQLTGIGGVPIVALTPASLNLASPGIGMQGLARTAVLSNTGADVLDISSLTIVGPNAADFSENHDCASTLSVGSFCSVNVTYKASTSNTETATLQFVDNAGGSPHSVALTGIVSAFGLTSAAGDPSSASVSAGQMATYNLMIGGQAFIGQVTLTCSGAPAAATCTVPASENLTATPINFQVMVSTTVRSSIMPPISPPQSNLPVVMLIMLVGLSVLLLNRKRRFVRAMTLGCASLGLILIASCGGGGGDPTRQPTGTPAGAYTLTVTATNGSTSESMNLTLNVL